MHLLLLLLVAGVSSQGGNIDQSFLDFVFSSTTSKNDLAAIVVKPTDASSVFVSKTGENCQCVPYYLCNENDVAVGKYDPETGYNLLDVRFGEDDCQESVEKCCTEPKAPEEVPKPKPDASKLKGCGYRNPKGVGVTITGGTGEEAQFGEFPWVVALIGNSNDSYVGVAAIIHPQVLVTAAHVAYKFDPNGLKVRAGEWDTQTIKEPRDHQERNVREIIIHSGFNSKNLNNDIALLHLDRPLNLDEHINMICLPSQDEVFDNTKNCIANGWGKDRFGVKGRYAVFLKKVELDIVERSRCTTLLQRTRLGSRFRLHSSFICAGGEAGKDTCTGDGGAPLACPIGDNRYKLAGLVSWGIGCGQEDVPAPYASLSVLRSWVDEKMVSLGYGTSTYAI